MEEMVYNGIDDDCNDLTLDDDLDEDGYDLVEDCDDMDNLINPESIEIPDNDIDENCDGIIEYTTNTKETKKDKITIYPNPTNSVLNIISSSLNLRYVRIYDIEGRLVLSQKIEASIDVRHLKSGLYILRCLDSDYTLMYNEKIVIIP